MEVTHRSKLDCSLFRTRWLGGCHYVNLYKPRFSHFLYAYGERKRMAAWRMVTILPNLYKRLEGEIKCAKCGQSIYMGEKAWSHMCPRKQTSYTEYYCILCFV